MHAQPDVVIVGAGAAGLATAIFLARSRPSTNIVILEGASRIGAKILVSGGGRCNVTNVRVTAADFYGGNANVLRRILAAFDERQTRSFFEELGVPLHEEEYGKLFPDTNSGKSVVRALLDEAARRRAKALAGHRVTAIEPNDRGFSLSVMTEGSNTSWTASTVVLATGGRSLPKTGSDGLGYELARALGHSIVPTTPALDPLVLEGSVHAALSGISHEVTFTLTAREVRPVRVTGPMLWTHFGLSGPAALNISRFWNRAVLEGRAPTVTADFTGALGFKAVERALIDAACDRPRSSVAAVLQTWVPMRVAQMLCTLAWIPSDSPIGQCPREARRVLAHRLTEWPVPVVGTRGYNFAEVTAGGVPLSEVNPSTLESRVRSGLYLVGEILDVDGRLGGFNFQWAWSSGNVAGTAIARRLERASIAESL